MSTVEQLIELVARKIDDDGYGDNIIVDFLNDGLLDIATKVLLPVLEEDAIITTILEENLVVLPSDFHRNVFAASPVISSKIPIRVLNSAGQMKRKYNRLDNTGDVAHIAIHKGQLIYQPIPIIVQEMIIFYYRVPDNLEDDDDTGLIALPANFHKLLVEYACQQIFSEIEDGIDGNKVNTLYHERRYEKGLIDLQTFIKDGQSLPDPPIVKGNFL